MPDINDLRQQRAQLNEQAQALASKEARGEHLSAEELAQFAQIQQDFQQLSAQIQRLEAAEQMAALSAKPLPTVSAATYGYGAEPKRPDIKGAKVARMIKAIKR